MKECENPSVFLRTETSQKNLKKWGKKSSAHIGRETKSNDNRKICWCTTHKFIIDDELECFILLFTLKWPNYIEEIKSDLFDFVHSLMYLLLNVTIFYMFYGIDMWMHGFGYHGSNKSSSITRWLMYSECLFCYVNFISVFFWEIDWFFWRNVFWRFVGK